LVRQAVQDGLLREFDDLIQPDGTVDLTCDPGMEIPLEYDGRTLSLTELFEALRYRQGWSEPPDDPARLLADRPPHWS
jgi:hypothetical protein